MPTLQTRLTDLIVSIGTDYKVILGKIGGDLNTLNTATKSSLIAAINEVNGKPSGTGGASINDNAVASTTETYSVSKIKNLNDAQDIVINNKASAVHTHTLAQITDAANKADVSAVVDKSTDQTIGGVKTFSSAPVVPDASFAIAKTNGLQAVLDAKATINDTAPSASSVYSSNKVTSAIATAVASLVNSAPAALDTLKELSDSLGGDANFATTITSALGNRLRVDAVQTLTAQQKAQGKANLDAYGSFELGNPDADLVAIYVTAKA